jgi:curved DNA binding protein
LFLAALAQAAELCKVDADVYTICQAVDAEIDVKLQKVYNSKKTKKLERGIAFPTCISINNVVGHYSPLADESVTIKDGDMVKIISGCHIDGFASIAAHTVVVGTCKPRQADVLLAAHHAMMAGERIIKDGATNHEVTEAMNKICADYNVNMVEGVLSHTVKKFCVDGNKVIVSKETAEAHVDEWIFAPGDVIGLDIYVSTGEGKPKQADARTTVYKRELENMYNLKINKSRQFFAEANKRFPSLPFCLRAFEDQTGAKVGVRECVDHDLMIPYPVLEEKSGEFVAHFKRTVAVLTKSTATLAGQVAFDATKFKGENELKDEAMKALVASEMWKREDKKKK